MEDSRTEEGLEWQRLELDRERLRHDIALRERELAVKEVEIRKPGWTSPAVLALAAAAIGLLGNAAVALINGRIEDRKAEYGRVLEMIKVGDPDKAAANLAMLLEAGLYDDRGGKLAEYLSKRPKGEGGALPVPGGVRGDTAPRRPLDPKLREELESLSLEGAPWMQVAFNEIGYFEVEGTSSSSRVATYNASIGLPEDDAIPWNSSFVNWVMGQAGISGTGSGRARSWLDWGVGLDEPKLGAIVVFSVPSDTQGIMGHVGFFIDATKDQVRVLGGNQGNEVSVRSLPKGRMLAVRWPLLPK